MDKWLSEQKYICGEEMTIADISAFCEVSGHEYLDEMIKYITPYKHLMSWYNKLKDIPEL